MAKPRWWCATVSTLGLAVGLAVGMAFGLLTSAAHAAADDWKGTLILPKKADSAIQAEDGSPVSMYDIGWPAQVSRTKGRYLYVRDDGGYSAKRAGGWIYTDDAVKLTESQTHFSEELGGKETAWSYWMRGISWENAGEPGIAILDYQNAIRVEPNTGIDDIYIRLGRLLAQEQLLGGRGRYQPELRSSWEQPFQRAEQINPNRPQLFYEWGYALSQACNCTEAKAARLAKKNAETAARAQKNSNSPPGDKSPKSDGKTAPADAKSQKSAQEALRRRGALAAENLPASQSRRSAKISMVGLEGGDNKSSGQPLLPTQPSKPTTGTQPAETLPPTNPQPVLDASSTVVATGPIAPSPEGSAAAVEALEKYQIAEKLNPNWWQLPLARAELMLNQCDEESNDGYRGPSKFEPQFLTTLLDHHSVWQKRKADPTAAPANAVAMSRGAGDDGDDTADASSDASTDSTSQSNTAVTKPPAVDVIATAVDDFNRAIDLNPNSLDAYRDRAEALRLANRLTEAEQSATSACNLCYYREPRSLRTLAQICNQNGRYQMGADYALRAAELTMGEEQQRFLRLWASYSQKASPESAELAQEAQKQGGEIALAVASAGAGFVAGAGRGADDGPSGDKKPAPPKRLGRIVPPPGFTSRFGGAAGE